MKSQSKILACVLPLLVACSEASSPTPPTSQAAEELRASLSLAPRFPPIRSNDGSFLIKPRRSYHPASHPNSSGSARVPRWASDPMLLQATDGTWIPVKRLGARPVEGRLSDGAIHYPNVLEKVDARVFATESGTEDLFTVHAPTNSLGYEVELPRGWSLHAAPTLAMVEIRDTSSSSQLRVWARGAWDARGTELRPKLFVQDQNIFLRLPNQATWPVLVDPEWTGADTPVLAREGASLIQISSGEVLISGGDVLSSGLSELFNPVKGTFSLGAGLLIPRRDSTTHILPSGKVLILGGHLHGTAAAIAEVYDPSAPSFEPGPQMPAFGGAVTSLSDGNVLLAGGWTQGTESSIHVYDPADNKFLPIGNLLEPRSEATATLLATASPLPERFLIAGGKDSQGTPLRSTEVCDSNASCTPGPTLNVARIGHTATLLPSGHVMVAGGTMDQPNIEIINVENGDMIGFSATPRSLHHSWLMPDGKVLILGGGPNATNTTTMVDPVAGTALEGPPLMHPRRGGAATLLYDGRVLTVGGDSSPQTAELLPLSPYGSEILEGARIRLGQTATLLPNGDVLLSGGGALGVREVDLWSRKSGSSSPIMPMHTPRVDHVALLLRSGRVLISGGMSMGAPSSQAEIYDWRHQRFDPISEMTSARVGHAMTLLTSGKVLVTGGDTDGTVEEWNPTDARFVGVGHLAVSRSAHAALRLPTGHVLITGGMDAKGAPIRSAEIWNPIEHKSQPLPSGIWPAGKTVGAMSASGTLMLASHQGTSLLDPSASQIEVRPPVVSAPISAIPSLFEGVLFCGQQVDGSAGSCGVSSSWQQATTPIFERPGEVLETVTPLIDGDLLLRAATTVKVHRIPALAVRPSIDTAPLEIRIRTQEQILGKRFASPSAVGSEELGPSWSQVPGVVFIPASSGAPIPFPVLSWTDETLTFSVPPTTFHGRGWIHVWVAGVPSLGWFVDLQAQSRGGVCEFDEECIDGFCVEGVCCENRCSQGCMSCLGSLTGAEDGACAPIREGLDPKEACPVRLCDTTGVCDGLGTCAEFAERMPCDEGKLCRDRVCVETLGEACTSKHDCAGGQVCSASMHCEVLDARPAPKDPGACSSGRSGQGLAWAGMLALLALVFRRRMVAERTQ